MERTLVRRFLYPAFLSPPSNLFTDQFAFRSTGSPTAAIICLLSTVTNLLLTNPYVIVISMDFSKAFDTVRHSTLMEKLAQLHLLDYLYIGWQTSAQDIRTVLFTMVKRRRSLNAGTFVLKTIRSVEH